MYAIFIYFYRFSFVNIINNCQVNFYLQCLNLFFKMLKQPENVISNDFKQHRLAAADSAIIAEYEDLVSDWMNTIENILMDSSDERFVATIYISLSFELG